MENTFPPIRSYLEKTAWIIADLKDTTPADYLFYVPALRVNMWCDAVEEKNNHVVVFKNNTIIFKAPLPLKWELYHTSIVSTLTYGEMDEYAKNMPEMTNSLYSLLNLPQAKEDDDRETHPGIPGQYL
jgi:hypothetical protein